MARLFSVAHEQFSERLEEVKLPSKKLIFVAYEGVIEEHYYFTELSNQLKDLTEYNVDFFPLEREKEDGNSHPYHVSDGMVEYYDEKIKNSHTFDVSREQLWIVVDVDRHFKNTENKTRKQNYDEYLQSLTHDGVEIKLAISKPCFELWLILHYKLVDNLDVAKILENKKISKDKTYIKDLCKQILVNHHHIQSQQYFENEFAKVKSAISQAQNAKLNQDNDLALDSVGTTVYKLLEQVIN